MPFHGMSGTNLTYSREETCVFVQDSGINLHWKRVSDIRCEADPALLNPGDVVSTVVYLTNSQFTGTPTTGKEPGVRVEWAVRIANLHAITEVPSPDWCVSVGGDSIYLMNWGLAFTIIAALLFQALYLRFLSRVSPSWHWSWQSITLILGTSLLSFAAAESMKTYLFGNMISKIMGRGIDHWLNAPWIVLNIAVLIYLFIGKLGKP
jgi:hypothetical protein